MLGAYDAPDPGGERREPRAARPAAASASRGARDPGHRAQPALELGHHPAHQLLRFLRHALSWGYLDFDDLGEVLSLVHRITALAEDRCAEYRARLGQRALLRAVARQQRRAADRQLAPVPF